MERAETRRRECGLVTDDSQRAAKKRTGTCGPSSTAITPAWASAQTEQELSEAADWSG